MFVREVDLRHPDARIPVTLKRQTFFLLAGLLALSFRPTYGYGPEGHDAVGEIAAERLAGTPAGAKVKEMLDGVTLGFAATIPDRIKSWDRGGDDDPHGFKMPEHPKLEAQLRAFWRANKASDQNDADHPSHHWFHYTDVPLAGNEKYADGAAGRSRWDIVHMINYCCRVLSGQESEQNERAITKPVAVVLLAHYVGDLHQPLHVGAEYFDDGRAANPDTDKQALPDEGGNTFILALADPPSVDPNAPRRRPKLHGYWDSNTVKFLMQEVGAEMKKDDPKHPAECTPMEFAHRLAAQEPANWKPTANLDVKDWAESWANEILPIAREAYDRLDYSQFRVETSYGKQAVGGMATERPNEKPPYADWSIGVVRVELEKAGYRLAAMLTKVLGDQPQAGASGQPKPTS